MIRILFLAATPVDQAHLRVRQEFDELRQALDSAAHGRRFVLIQEFAAAPDQLQALLFRHQPQIVHFSGHGTDSGLVFEGTDGSSHLVAPQTLRDLFANFKQQVRCVVLNACYSASQANAIATVIDSVVGMGDALTDDAALAFAVAFYRALANGTTLAGAVDLGRNQLDLQNLDEAHKPQLLAERIDPSRVYALDWDDTGALTETDSPTSEISTGGGTAIQGKAIAGRDIVGHDKIDQHFHYYGGESPQSAPATPRGIFGLYPFNENFFGRDEELATLHNLLQTAQSVSICPVITGMGGLGKTQLAAHYVRAHVADYPDGIFWITAANLTEIRPQLADFCVALGLPVADPQRSSDLTEQKISAFKGYLDQHPRALLIFDNVEEPDHLRTRAIGVQLTALALGGKVIVTTRRRKVASNKFAELALQRLLPAPARQILTTARPNLATDPDLDLLCAQFGYLPLMLNLAAAALKKRGGTIAGYLQRLHTLGSEQLHGTVAKVTLDDYHKSLTAVLQEQWAMLQGDNARLLLRVAGQLPEAAVIPIARLGLLAGLVDVDEWERPLSDALDELERTSLIEGVDQETLRLHPLVRDFAAAMTAAADRAVFCIACAQHMSTTYSDLKRLGQEYAKRGIDALLDDLIIAIDLAQPGTALPPSPVASLQLLLSRLQMERDHLQGNTASWRPERFWQQLLPRTMSALTYDNNQLLTNLLHHTGHWLPYWSQQGQSTADEPSASHESTVKAVMVDSQHIISISDDGMLKIWYLATGKPKQILASHKAWITTAAVDGQHIVSTSDDGTIKVWHLATGKPEQTLAGHESAVYAVAVVDGQRIVSVSDDRTLKVWHLATGHLEQTLTGHEAWVTGVAVVDRQRIVSASLDGTIKVWHLATGQPEWALTGHESAVTAMTVVDS